jgi:3-oxoacyl-[acyl-carrier protein] reductase
MLLKGKKALITGGTRGIGYAIAKKFAAEGADIAFTYLSSSGRAAEVVDELMAMDVKAVAYQSDAGSYTQAETLINDVTTALGGIDILINNAGITRDNLLLRMTEQQWDEVIQSNLKSVFNLTKHVSKGMLRQRSGSIINLTSIVGMRGQAGQSNYSASKAGIIGFTKSIAEEFGARGIRSNAISPGFIETDMTHILSEDTKKSFMASIPLQRMGQANDIAHAALFLASDMSTYITGQVLSVCGGMSR